MSVSEVIDGQAEEVSTELTIAPATPATLFRTDDPVQVLARATEVADALADVIKKRNLFVNISDKSHVLVEGWLTLGSMLGVTPVCEWTRPIENGWEARVVAQTLDGRQIGAAEAQCLSTEKRGPWKSSEDYAIRSMAQTRATSKALASVLRFVVTLAGYEGTPAEEAEGMAAERRQKPATPKPQGDPLPGERVNALGKAVGALGLTYGQIDTLLGACGIDGLRAASGKALRERLESLSAEQADALEAELGRQADG